MKIQKDLLEIIIGTLWLADPRVPNTDKLADRAVADADELAE